ncbi:MAG TPA: hypothetical protein VIK14_09220 [Ignavibacteria bacterium]
MINKKFDAVRMMRTIRDELNNKYLKNPDKYKKDLERINIKYGISKSIKRKRKTA